MKRLRLAGSYRTSLGGPSCGSGIAEPGQSLARDRCGGKSESTFQPEWSPGGVLHFCLTKRCELCRLIAGGLIAVSKEAYFAAPPWSSDATRRSIGRPSCTTAIGHWHWRVWTRLLAILNRSMFGPEIPASNAPAAFFSAAARR